MGWPAISTRFNNPMGRFGHIFAVTTRIANQLSGEGNSAVFANLPGASSISSPRPSSPWISIQIICASSITSINIDTLLVEYAHQYFASHAPKARVVIVQIEAQLNDKTNPRHMLGWEKRVIALEQYLSQIPLYDPVLNGLRSALRYDRTYFNKIVAVAVAEKTHHQHNCTIAGPG